MINFKNLSLSLVLMGFLSVAHAMAMEGSAEDSQGPTVRVQKKYQALKAIGERYVTFLRKIADTPATQDDVSQLFSPQCKKVVNDEVILTSSSDLPAQLNKAREIAGKWEIIETTTMTASSDDGTCTLQFKWKAENMGKHTTMLVLYLDELGKISQIHEVYNEYKKKTLGSS